MQHRRRRGAGAQNPRPCPRGARWPEDPRPTTRYGYIGNSRGGGGLRKKKKKGGRKIGVAENFAPGSPHVSKVRRRKGSAIRLVVETAALRMRRSVREGRRLNRPCGRQGSDVTNQQVVLGSGRRTRHARRSEPARGSFPRSADWAECSGSRHNGIDLHRFELCTRVGQHSRAVRRRRHRSTQHRWRGPRRGGSEGPLCVAVWCWRLPNVTAALAYRVSN